MDPFDPRFEHPFSPEREVLRQEKRAEAAARVNVHASGTGGGGYFRRGWRAERQRGPWAQLNNLPPLEGRQNLIAIVGWRPYFSLTLDITRRKR